MSYSATINYDSAAALNFSSSYVEVASSTLRLIDLGGGTYTTTPQLVTSQHENTISSLTSFTQSATTPANTAIKYQLVLNSVAYWYSATLGSWTKADGTYATANIATDINAQASHLFSQLNLLVPQFLSVNIWLATTSASARPVLTSNTIGYTWTNQNAVPINVCSISCSLLDLAGAVPFPTDNQPVAFTVSCDKPFFHGANLVEPFTLTTYFDNSTGNALLSIIETATPGIKLNFAVTFYEVDFNSPSIKTVKLAPAIVPNQPAITLNNLTTVAPYDFG